MGNIGIYSYSVNEMGNNDICCYSMNEMGNNDICSYSLMSDGFALLICRLQYILSNANIMRLKLNSLSSF